MGPARWASSGFREDKVKVKNDERQRLLTTGSCFCTYTPGCTHMCTQKEVKIDVTLICWSCGEGEGLEQELVLELCYLSEL